MPEAPDKEKVDGTSLLLPVAQKGKKILRYDMEPESLGIGRWSHCISAPWLSIMTLNRLFDKRKTSELHVFSLAQVLGVHDLHCSPPPGDVCFHFWGVLKVIFPCKHPKLHVKRAIFSNTK